MQSQHRQTHTFKADTPAYNHTHTTLTFCTFTHKDAHKQKTHVPTLADNQLHAPITDIPCTLTNTQGHTHITAIHLHNQRYTGTCSYVPKHTQTTSHIPMMHSHKADTVLHQ